MYLADVASLDFNDDSLSGADTHAIIYCEENIGWSCVIALTGQLKWQTHSHTMLLGTDKRVKRIFLACRGRS